MALLELSHVTQGFFADRRKTEAMVALDDVSLAIEEGEFVSLVGPSGCGKTVTLSLMAGFLQPTEGTVSFKGCPVAKPSPHRGVVFQEYSLMPWLTVRQNLMFALRAPAKALGRPFERASAAKRADEALSQVGLAHAADRRPNTLSGGMRQRVAIARLLAMDSDVFLMDEPFSALDEQTRGELDASLLELWRCRRKTIVFVTQDISEAVAVSSRIVLFSRSPGRIAGEWRLGEGFDRGPASAEAQAVASEIRGLLGRPSREPISCPIR